MVGTEKLIHEQEEWNYTATTTQCWVTGSSSMSFHVVRNYFRGRSQIWETPNWMNGKDINQALHYRCAESNTFLDETPDACHARDKGSSHNGRPYAGCRLEDRAGEATSSHASQGIMLPSHSID